MKKSSQRGFTLFELLIVLTVMGLIIVTLSTVYLSYTRGLVESKTEESLGIIISSLGEFQSRTGRYPCPADPTLTSSDALYGFERCVGGITTTGRNADGIGGGDTVLIGSIPFKTMSDPDGDPLTDDGITDIRLVGDHTKDGYNNYLTYAITQNLTNVATFNEDWGAISIVDEHDNTVIAPLDSANFVVVSHGEDGKGAYTSDGVIAEPCGTTTFPMGTAPNPVRNEDENCNNDAIFLSGLQYDSAQFQNDDSIRFLISMTAPVFWNYTGPNQVMNSNPGFVGVGTDVPEERLHIDGDLTATTVYAESLCDAEGDDCMPIEVLGGDDPNMDCGPGRVVVAIENNQVSCVDPTINSITGTCPAGEVIYAISNTGNIRCRPP